MNASVLPYLMHTKELKLLGLTDGEAKVYEALLNTGSSTVGPIVKHSKIAYSNIYEVLDRLMEKGLVSFVKIEKTKYFQAVSPTRLADYLEKKEEEIGKQKVILQKIIPELNALQKSMPTQDAEIFIGTKGINTAYEQLLTGAKKGEEVCYCYVHDQKYYEVASSFYFKQWLWIKSFGLKGRGISNEEYRHTSIIKKNPSFLKNRFVPFPVPSNIDIFKDRVLFIVWREKPFGFLIHSKDLAEQFQAYFEALWKVARA